MVTNKQKLIVDTQKIKQSKHSTMKKVNSQERWAREEETKELEKSQKTTMAVVKSITIDNYFKCKWT